MIADDTATGDQQLGLLPMPVSLRREPGVFRWSSATRIETGPGAERAGALLREWLAPQLGASESADESVVTLECVPEGELPAEGYRLDVRPQRITLLAAGHAGLVYGVQTLRQLMPATVYAEATERADEALVVPCCSIEDHPRFSWRGALLDTGRWFLPIEFLYRFVDLLSMHRLNVLQLHLTEDQGWRFEVLKHPRLTEIGSMRAESPFGHRSDRRRDGIPHGGYYRQSELRDLVAYASDRAVTIVPEIDLPGHTTAMIAAYPELGNNPDADVSVSPRWGIHHTVLNMEESTVEFCKDVVAELLDVFPSQHIHLGGDECPKWEWQNSRRAQARAEVLGLDSPSELQAWFTGEMNEFLRSKGRRLICWDDVLDGPIAEDVTIMSWRDPRPVADAANAGHRVVLSPADALYLDMYQTTEPGQPIAFGGLNTLKDVFDYEATLPGLRKDAADRVLGVQGQLWGEYMPTADRVEDMAFPRLCALAEVGWSATRAPYRAFLERLEAHLERLDQASVGYRRLRPDLVQRDGTSEYDRSVAESMRANLDVAFR